MNSDALRDEAIAHLGYRLLLSFDVVTQRIELVSFPIDAELVSLQVLIGCLEPQGWHRR